jgi:hypothetical protein
VSFSGVVAVVALAILQGGLVALPRGDALTRLARLQSPVWAVVLPVMILAGTFGVLALPTVAPRLLVVAAVATPLLAMLAVLAVVRGQRPAVIAAATAVAAAALSGGWLGEVSASTITALGCLPLGAALVQLTPTRWVPAGALAMCAVDASLLALGIGQPASAEMTGATVHFHGPILDVARIGPISTDYPDLLLAAVLGGVVSGHTVQRRAAVLVSILVAGYGMLLPLVNPLPATVPIALAFILLRWGRGPLTWRAADCAACGHAASERLSFCLARRHSPNTALA